MKTSTKNDKTKTTELAAEQARNILGGLLAGDPEDGLTPAKPTTKKKAAKRVAEPGWSLTY